MNTQEAVYKLYDERGDLLDIAAIAALNEKPFYMQKQLDDLNDQIKLLETVEPIDTSIVLVGNFPTTITRQFNPDLSSGCRYRADAEEGCGNDTDLYDYARGR